MEDRTIGGYEPWWLCSTSTLEAICLCILVAGNHKWCSRDFHRMAIVTATTQSSRSLLMFLLSYINGQEKGDGKSLFAVLWEKTSPCILFLLQLLVLQRSTELFNGKKAHTPTQHLWPSDSDKVSLALQQNHKEILKYPANEAEKCTPFSEGRKLSRNWRAGFGTAESGICLSRGMYFLKALTKSHFLVALLEGHLSRQFLKYQTVLMNH